MPYLKAKVQRAAAQQTKPSSPPDSASQTGEQPVHKKDSLALIKVDSFKAKKSIITKPRATTTASNKNIIKNYARAMINFALSRMANPCLGKLLRQERVDVRDFYNFMAGHKEEVNSIKNLRQLLLIEKGDSNETAAFKRIFKEVSIWFIKFFSVNWVYSSKVSDKITHIKYRFKILRRIKNPEYFTYLESFSRSN